VTDGAHADGARHAVVVAGGGPTGLMLAGELAVAGVDVAVVERRADQQLDGSRSGGLHARTIEVLDQRGIADRFIDAGQKHPAVGYSGIALDISDFPTRHPYVLALWQKDFEPILAGWVDELGVPVYRETDVTGFTQHDDGVEIELSGGRTLGAGYLVGCDGGRSTVRKVAGIDFAGLDAATSWIIAEATMDGEPEIGMRHDSLGTHGIGPSGNDGLLRIVLTERDLPTTPGTDPDLGDLRVALETVYGSDFGLRSAAWISRFNDTTRQAASYRDGRVLLAGDAAHVHPPHGGQGLNTGVQDAVNLGWKLAQVVHGTSPDGLLDSYQAERHPVGARVLRNTMAQVALGRADERHQALRDAVAELLEMDGPRKHIAAMLSGLDIRYDLGDDPDPLVGRRAPDVDLDTANGPTRISELLRDARPVLVRLTGADGFDGFDWFDLSGAAPWRGRIDVVTAAPTGPWELPVIGEVTPPAGLVIRPDGHVAWTGDPTRGDPTRPDLTAVLTTWFG
jgi:3-(3-hydroxy-phenyl)propionate hydroxylase